MSVDFERAAMLLSLMEKLVTVAPKATDLFGLAQAELNDLNSEAKAIRAEAAAEEQKKAQAEAEAQAKAAKEAEEEAEEETKPPVTSKTEAITRDNARRL